MRNLFELPAQLPIPIDDGSASHLNGLNLVTELGNNFSLLDSNNSPFLLIQNLSVKSVVFIFPKAGSILDPNSSPEEWDNIPGARGCTPQACSFRDEAAEFEKLKISVYGLSVQTPDVLKEIRERNHLKYHLISDSDYLLTSRLKLPTFKFGERTLLKRIVLYIENGSIKHVFYLVFPPNECAFTVLKWLKG